MLECSHCGRENLNTSRFCMACGRPIEARAGAPAGLSPGSPGDAPGEVDARGFEMAAPPGEYAGFWIRFGAYLFLQSKMGPPSCWPGHRSPPWGTSSSPPCGATPWGFTAWESPAGEQSAAASLPPCFSMDCSTSRFSPKRLWRWRCCP